MADVEATIRNFIVKEIMFEEDETILQFDDPLFESGIIDSAGITNLVLFLESEFDTTIALEDLVPQNFASVESISGFLKLADGALRS